MKILCVLILWPRFDKTFFLLWCTRVRARVHARVRAREPIKSGPVQKCS